VGVVKINNRETLNAKSRFEEEASAEQYLKNRQTLVELEKREYIKDKFLSPKPQQQAKNSKHPNRKEPVMGAIVTEWICVTFKHYQMKHKHIQYIKP